VTPQTPRVLVATSGSLASRQATAVASNLASTFEAQLVIGRTPRFAPRAVTAKTRLWVSTRAPCPVLPVTAEQSSATRPAAEPVLVT
jgi:hypothetical protein